MCDTLRLDAALLRAACDVLVLLLVLVLAVGWCPNGPDAPYAGPLLMVYKPVL